MKRTWTTTTLDSSVTPRRYNVGKMKESQMEKIKAESLKVGDVCSGSGAVIISRYGVDPYDRQYVNLGVRYSNGDERLVAWRRGTLIRVERN